MFEENNVTNFYVLVSSHGSFLCLNEKNQISGTKKLSDIVNDRNKNIFKFCIEESDGYNLSINNVQVFVHSVPNSDLFVLKHEEKFLTAEPDNRIVMDAIICRDWEYFSAIPFIDIERVMVCMKSIWHIPNTQIRVYPEQILFSRGGKVNFNGFLFDTKKIPSIFQEDKIVIRKEFVENFEFLDFVNDQEVFVFSPLPLDTKFDPCIWIRPMGNTANKALQYLVAKKIQQKVPRLIIKNIPLEEWGIGKKDIRPPLNKGCRLHWYTFWLDIDGISDCLNRKVIDTLFLDGFCFNLDHYPLRAVSKQLLGETPKGKEVTGFGSDVVVCNIRAGEVLHGVHPDYIVLPPEYYKIVERESGLNLVFYGQVSDNPYIEKLKEAFPDSEFIQGKGAEYDFEVIRKSTNIAMSISTFSWLASWLSNAVNIYLPIGGIFNPNQTKLQDFLPVDEEAYKFIKIPFCKSVNLYENKELFFARQDMIGSNSKIIKRKEAKKIKTRSKKMWPKQPLLTGFDDEFYLKNNVDVENKLYWSIPSALEHYMHEGYKVGKDIFEFDENFYALNYPDVAVLVGEGRYENLQDHYKKFGISNGYLAFDRKNGKTSE